MPKTKAKFRSYLPIAKTRVEDLEPAATLWLYPDELTKLNAAAQSWGLEVEDYLHRLATNQLRNNNRGIMPID